MPDLSHIQEPFTDGAGNLLAGTTVDFEVRRESDNGLAAIFVEQTGATPIVNPSQTTTGYIDCYVAGSIAGYRIIATATIGGSPYEREMRHVAKGNLAERDFNDDFVEEVRTLIEGDIPTKINFMKLLGGEPSIEDWTAAPASVTDWAPEIENAIFQAVSEGWRILRVPYHEGFGSYDLLTTLEIAYPIKLAGYNLSTSVFAQKHTGAGINCTGENGTGGGLYDLSVALVTTAGSPLYNIAVSAHQDAGDPQDQYAADFWEMKNINCTVFSGAAPQYIYLFDGNARDDSDGGTVAIGLRNIWGERLVGFGASNRSMEIRKCKDPSFSKLSLFGTLGNGDLYIGSDSAVAGQLCEAVKLDEVLCGDLIVERLVTGHFDMAQMQDLISVNTASAVLLDAAWMTSDPTGHALVNSLVTCSNFGAIDV